MLTKIRQMGQRTLKSSAAPLLAGLHSGRRWLDGDRHLANQVMILGYHQVVADITRAERETIFGMAISAQSFRRQMEFLRERYEVLSLAQAVAVLRGEASTTRPAVVITFDDGYRNTYEQAWPILRELELPATIFVTTGLVGTNQWLDHDLLYWYARQAKLLGLSLRVPLVKAGLNLREVASITAEVDPQRLCDQLVHLPQTRRDAVLQRLGEFLGEPAPEQGGDFSVLDWAMIREMAVSGISFGAHTERHPMLTLETAELAEREIRNSKAVLEAQLGGPVQHFAYPNGCHNEAVRKLVQRLGFTAALTTEKRLNRSGTDLFALGRTCLCEESTRGLTGQYSEAVARLRLAV